MLIGDLIERRSQKSPHQRFWDAGDHTDRLDPWNRSHTYSELAQDADRVARALAGGGLVPGNHAAICASNGYAYAAAHFGAARAGLVLAHLNARFTASELASLGAHCDAEILFLGPDQAGAVAEARPALGKVRTYVLLPGGADAAPAAPCPEWAIPWEDWLHRGEGHPFTRPPERSPEAPFQLLYTSGTTGTPKGALISHRAKIRQGMTHALNMGLVEGDRIWGGLPLYHQFAQWLLLVAAPLAGAAIVVPDPKRVSDTERIAGAGGGASAPQSIFRALSERGITHLPAVPTLLHRWLDALKATERQAPAPALRCIVYGGAPIPAERIPQLRERFPGARLFQGFGQTETGYCLGLMDADHDLRPETLGRPDLFSRVRLVDEAGADVPDGAPGEIIASTPYLMNGYYKAPEATAEYFAFGAGWGRTGDLAVRDEAGFYTLAGRRNELVISGGVNIYPAEVEAVLQAHPAVDEAAVFGLPDAEWGEVLAVAVIPARGQHLTPESMAAHCRATLAGFKCPRHFFLLKEFPRTHSGKVQKHRLRQQLLRDKGEIS